LSDKVREVSQGTGHGQGFGIVDDDLNPQDGRAFGIQLEREQAKVDFEHGQVIPRSLGHDLQAGLFVSLLTKGASLGPKDGFEPFDIQTSAGAVNQGLNELFHLQPTLKQQIATVFDLEEGIVIAKTGSFLVSQGDSKAQTGGIQPAFTNLTQWPYSVHRTQGLCQLRQLCAAADVGKTIAFFLKGKPGSAGLTGQILVTIEDNLRPKRGMPTHPNSHVTPVRVNDMKIM
jgi:hypothetical protein